MMRYEHQFFFSFLDIEFKRIYIFLNKKQNKYKYLFQKKFMGRVRNKTVKKAAKVLIEKYYMKLTSDFHYNKKILSEVGEVPTKKLRNKIAGFATHLLDRIQRGPVKGISLKIQEEERERKMDFVPEKSVIDVDNVQANNDVRQMLSKTTLPNLEINFKADVEPEQKQQGNKRRAQRRNQ
ncbi:hypothetical protein pb186bvf_008321 [Paramecium bursaria]